MSLLNFKDDQSRVSRPMKPLKAVIGVGLLVGTIALGSTLAASINLNGGGPVEFGQGVTQTVACDDEVVVTPLSSFVNDDADGGFKFTAISLSELDGSLYEDSSDKGCAGKTFTIKTYNSGGALLTPTYSISLDSNGDFSSPDGNTEGNSEGLSNSSVKLLFMGTLINAESVYRITIESSDSIATEPTEYSIGETGPGGGIVYYYSEVGFTCGPSLLSTCNYLEYAPNKNWNGEVNDSDPNYQWAVSDYQSIEIGSGAQNTSIGSGYANSVAITTQGNDITTAAGASRGYRGGGKSDWYLPSRDELNQLCVFVHGLGVDANGNCITDGVVIDSNVQSANAAAKGFQIIDYYWNSTEGSSNGVQGQWFYDGSFYNPAQKQYGFKVRPIRAF